jgi:pimeloyl-ACP methyl ester carboxylesterase
MPAADDLPTPAELDAALGPVHWDRAPAGADVDSVDAPSGELARITLGPADGRRVVLVPGATGSKEDFVVMMPLLAAQGFRVESFDLAGQFGSAAAGPQRLQPPADRYSMSLFTDDLLAVLADRPGPAHLLGYSFAGTVAAVVAVERPELVASLTLLSTPPLAGQVFRGMKIVGPLTKLASPRVAAAVMIAGIRLNLNRVDGARLRFVRDRLRHTDRRSVDDIIALMMRSPDLRTALAAAGIPTLVAVGTGDLWPTGLHREFATAIGARLATYPTGHSPCETTPHQLVADMVTLFRAADAT